MITIEEIHRYIKLRNKGISSREYPRLTTGYDINHATGTVSFFNGKNQLQEALPFGTIRKALGYKS